MAIATTGGINYISDNNSTTTPLGIGGIFTGTRDVVTIFKSVVVSLYTDQSSATNGLSVQFSTDNTNWDFRYNFDITAGIAFSKTVQVIAEYFRIVYTNGGVAQGSFRLQSILVASQSSEIIAYPENNTTSQPVNITGPVGAFGELETSSKEASVIVSFQYNINAAIVTTTLTGTATVTQANAMAHLNTMASAGTALLQSVALAQYTPAVGLKIFSTAVFNSGVAGTSQWIGSGNTNNGYYFGYNGTEFSIRHQNNGTNTYISQTNWNADTMDGNGNSGIILNPQTGNVYITQVQWLGYGIITFSIENPTDGSNIIVHIIKYPNSATVPSLDKTGFYGRATIDNGVTPTAMTLRVTCIAIFLEGNILARPGIKFSSFNSASTATNQLQSVATIRNRTTFAGVTNFIPIFIDNISVSTEGNKPVRVQVISRPTNTFTFADVNTNQSVVEFSTDTQTITTNTNTATYYTFFLGKADSQTNSLTLDRFFVFPGQTISVATLTTNATNETGVSIAWREFF